MTSKAAKRRVITIIFAICGLPSCGQLKPEAQKTRTPESTYQYARVDAIYDVSADTWSYTASMTLRKENASGESAALMGGENIVINGETIIDNGSSTTPMYYVTKTGIPPATFVFAWTATNGLLYSNECSWVEFAVSEVPSTQSKSSGFDIVLTLPNATGSAYGHMFQQTSNTYQSGEYIYKGISPSSPSAIMNFLSSHMASLSAGSSSLKLEWANSSFLTNATAAGGTCSVVVSRKYTVMLTN
jgi:hypothetical protein